MRMLRPDKTMIRLKAKSTFLGLEYVTRRPVHRLTIMSAEYMTLKLVVKLPGKCLTMKLIT